MAKPRTVPNRRPLRVREQHQPPLVDWNYDYSGGAAIYLALSQPVQISGTPGFVPNAGQQLVSVTLIAPTELELVFSPALGGGDSISLPAYDPAVRTKAGGYLVPGTMIIE